MKKISRRSFLAVAGASTAALALTACGGSSSSTAASSTASSAPASSAAGNASGAAADPKVTLVYAEVNPLDTIVGQTGSHFKEKVEELTGGSVVIPRSPWFTPRSTPWTPSWARPVLTSRRRSRS